MPLRLFTGVQAELCPDEQGRRLGLRSTSPLSLVGNTWESHLERPFQKDTLGAEASASEGGRGERGAREGVTFLLQALVSSHYCAVRI